MQVSNNQLEKPTHQNNNQQGNSTTVAGEPQTWRAIATKFRRGRFVLFETLISSLPRPLHILDVGGTQRFWDTMNFNQDEVNIDALNWKHMEVTRPNMTSLVGDARNMPEFQDNAFDIVFSNSVIEHVGNYEQQGQMAQEVRRVGQRYFVQTPNRYFPIEPHFLFPFFQFLPVSVRVFLVMHFKLGWGHKIKDKQKAVRNVNRIRLMTEKELKTLFPEAKIYKEKFLGLTKSFIVYYGW